MAGIGDYIHFKKENYRKYGTLKPGNGTNFSDVTSVFNQQRKMLKSRIPSTNSSNLKGLENFLNGMMYGKDDDGKAYDEVAIKELQKLVETEFQKAYSNFDINFKNGIEVYHPEQGTQAQRISIKTLHNYLKTIQNMVNGSIKLSKTANINEIESVLNQLETYLKSNSQQTGMISLKNDLVAADLIPQINRVLKMQSLPWNKAIGDVFEYWLALASQYADGLAEVESDKIIEQCVKGTSKSGIQISFDKFSSDYVDIDQIANSGVFKQGWQRIDDSNSFMFDKPIQNKLDVLFKWDGDELRISAKNYKLADSGKLIHLVSGTSLLYLIQAENVDFINHWLNCVAGSKSNNLGKILQDAHTTMKLTLFVQALTGMNQGSGFADTFVLNNRTKKHIYVRSMKEILDAVENNVEAIKISNYPNSIPNKWVGKNMGVMSQASAKQRISNLIAALQTYKISVSMSSSVLDTG